MLNEIICGTKRGTILAEELGALTCMWGRLDTNVRAHVSRNWIGGEQTRIVFNLCGLLLLEIRCDIGSLRDSTEESPSAAVIARTSMHVGRCTKSACRTTSPQGKQTTLVTCGCSARRLMEHSEKRPSSVRLQEDTRGVTTFGRRARWNEPPGLESPAALHGTLAL
jgi:hypothetical protein